MAEPFGTGAGVVGVIGLAIQITQLVVQFGLDWKEAPKKIVSFMAELGTLKTVLSETNSNILLNPEFKAAFQNQPSSLLSQLGASTPTTDTKFMLDICQIKLESLLAELKKNGRGHSLGWDRLKRAFLAKGTRESVEDLCRQCQTLNNLLSIDTAALVATTYKEVKESRKEHQEWHQADAKILSDTKSGVDQSIRWQENQDRQAILDWLTPIDYAPQQHDLINRWQAGTGSWLLESLKFQELLETKGKTLLCLGIPGAGKTIITAVVIDHLASLFAKDPTVGVAYIYCNFRRHDEQKATDLLTSVLKQLTQGMPSLPDEVRSLYDSHMGKGTRPTFDEIIETLRLVAGLYSRIFVIVDALDECQVSDSNRTKFLSEIFKLQEKCQASIFTTSRFDPSIEETFRRSTQLEIRATKEDVGRYLDGHMFQLPGFVLRTPELQDEIKAGITNAVDGMFLLALLHLDSLKGKKSPKAIRNALKTLPTGSEAYDYAYKDAMERIEAQLPDQEELAKQVLSWITCARRPLNTSEIEHAIAVEVGEARFDPDNICQAEDMISVCAGLVTVDQESRIIRLVHYTTQEYFERTQDTWFPNAEADIARICVTYLSFRIFNSGPCQTNLQYKERLETNKLYEYAASNWGEHARETSTLCDGVIEFLERELNLGASTQAMWISTYSIHTDCQQFPKQATGLHIAAYFGLEGAVKALLNKGHISREDVHGNTPLFWAVRARHEATVKLLLDSNVDVNVKNHYGDTVLILATEYGYEAIIKLLLDRKADVNSLNRFGETPLFIATERGRMAIIKLLLSSNADINLKDRYGHTPLFTATRDGYKTIVKLLLDNKADANCQSHDGGTILALAAAAGRDETVKLLLDSKANIDLQNDLGQTPLSRASHNGREATVKLLLERKANVNLTDNDGQTPLFLAVKSNHCTVVKLLLDNKADINFKDRWGRTPLFWVIDDKQAAMEKLLLSRNAKVNVKNQFGETPLSIAVELGCREIVKLLLNSKADVNSKDSWGRTPLLRAATAGYDGIAKLLIDYIADVNSKDAWGQTALSHAVRNQHEAVAKLLRERTETDTVLKDSHG